MYIIEDWMGKHVYTDKEFKSFEDAREFISEVAEQVASESDTAEYEEVYDGVCEDL